MTGKHSTPHTKSPDFCNESLLACRGSRRRNTSYPHSIGVGFKGRTLGRRQRWLASVLILHGFGRRSQDLKLKVAGLKLNGMICFGDEKSFGLSPKPSNPLNTN